MAQLRNFKKPEVDDAVVSVLKKEIERGKFILKRYNKLLAEFEKKYEMKTNEFIKKFEFEKLGDNEDFFEWFALNKAKNHWERKLKLLRIAA